MGDLVVELIHGESDGKDDDGDQADCHATVAYLDGQVCQLGLRWGEGEVMVSCRLVHIIVIHITSSSPCHKSDLKD